MWSVLGETCRMRRLRCLHWLGDQVSRRGPYGKKNQVQKRGMHGTENRAEAGLKTGGEQDVAD